MSDYIKTGVMAMHAGPGVSTSDDAGEVCSNSSTSDDAREVCSYRPVERKSSLAHIFNFLDHTGVLGTPGTQAATGNTPGTQAATGNPDGQGY